MERNQLRVALDGPSGAGKSSIAKVVAAKTGLLYVDTGALYRTVGLHVYNCGIATDDTAGIIRSLETLDIKLTYREGVQCVLLNGESVGEKIRTEIGSKYSSAVSKVPEVRAYLLDMQRQLVEAGGIIMDGRDIGTVIMPEAEIKIFMTASMEERAKRRHKEQQKRGIEVSYEEVLEAMIARDKQDSERDTAPLKPADDAIWFDNGNYDVEGSANYIVGLMDAYLAK